MYSFEKKERERKQASPSPKGLTSLRLKAKSSIQDDNPILTKTSETDTIMEIYEPFLWDVFVSLNSGIVQYTSIKITSKYWCF